MSFLDTIEKKVRSGQRLSREDGLVLYASDDLARIGALADFAREKISGPYVYYNVNCHVNLTNICAARCKFCAFGCDEDSHQAYEMSEQQVREKVTRALQDPDLSGLHIVSGLHPHWSF
ncbi:MAG: aminofutalosine synthase MqnE, partial [Selenomonadaceae bacterium]